MLAVDHEERRKRIAEVAADVIAQEGLDAATIRRIAAEIGCSTTIVTHYFSDKEQLLLWAYRVFAQQGYDQIDEVLSRDPADIVSVLVAMMPIDEISMQRWRLYLAFWDRATRDPQFAHEQRLHMDLALSRIAEVVRRRNGDCADVEGVSRVLNALVHGIALQALVKPQWWPAEEIRTRLADQVEIMLGAPTTPGEVTT